MKASTDDIRQSLASVFQERRAREADPALGAAVQAVKTFQQARFAQTYADLLLHPEMGAAAQFFLDDLYGPGDFSKRDAQFERVLPTLARLFPADVVGTVERLAQLHALTEALDTRMGRALLTPGADISPQPGTQPGARGGGRTGGRTGERTSARTGTQTRMQALSDQAYDRAWCTVGGAAERAQQIHLVVQIGNELSRLTRKPLLRHSLRLMRGPAEAAGMGDLQHFLESGFDAFKKMRLPQAFLETVSQREAAYAAARFAAG